MDLDGEGEAMIDANESVNPLLQVTLPIVLFLAFVVVTEVSSLRQTLERYQGEFRSPEGVLIKARDDAIIELQRQLLLEAARAVAAEQEAALDIGAYRRAMPHPREIIAGQLSEAFRTASARLATSLGAAAQPATLNEMARLTKDRFHEAADKIARERRGAYAEKLALHGDGRSNDNLDEARAQLAGRLTTMVDAAKQAQLELVLAWQNAGEVDSFVQGRPKEAWAKMQADPSEAGTQAAHFVNIEVEALHQRLDELGVPFLDDVWRDAS